jgi:hypothetical protein
MTTPTTNFPTIIPNDESNPLAAIPSGPAVPAELLQELHERFQGALLPLDDLLRQKTPDLVVTSGRTAGTRFFLFTYRTYSSPSHESIDPVIVGLTFALSASGISADADASGEENGDIVFAVPRQTVAFRNNVLVDVAVSAAGELVLASERIANALADQTRIAG